MQAGIALELGQIQAVGLLLQTQDEIQQAASEPSRDPRDPNQLNRGGIARYGNIGWAVVSRSWSRYIGVLLQPTGTLRTHLPPLLMRCDSILAAKPILTDRKPSHPLRAESDTAVFWGLGTKGVSIMTVSTRTPEEVETAELRTTHICPFHEPGFRLMDMAQGRETSYAVAGTSWGTGAHSHDHVALMPLEMVKPTSFG